MKKFLPYLVLAIVIVAGVVGGIMISKNSGDATSKINKQTFLWGVTARPHALAKYTAKSWDAQLDLAKELNVKYMRVSWHYDVKPSPEKFMSTIVKQNEAKGLSTYLILEDDSNLMTVPDAYQAGYKVGFDAATLFKGRVKYYQLLNEAGSVSLRGGQYSGENESDYDVKKYTKVRDWIKGASEGIAKADSSAYTIVTDQWTHFAFFSMLERDGVKYDIIGWDWFSDMGFMGDKKMSDGRTVLEHLQDFKKPIILAEVNARPDGPSEKQVVDEKKQAEFMRQMAEWAYNSKVIKGFFVLELMDTTNTGDRGYIDRYGIIETQKNAKGVGEVVKKREAFTVLSEIIKKYK